MSHFEPLAYRITAIKGNMVTVASSKRTVTRNVSFLKKWEGEVQNETQVVGAEQTPVLKQPAAWVFLFIKKPDEELDDELNDEDGDLPSVHLGSLDSEEDEDVHEDEDQNEPRQDVTFYMSSGEESKAEDGDLLTADEEEQEAVQERLGTATGVVQAAVRAFETNDDGQPKSPEQAAAARASRTTRNKEVNYRDARGYTKQP
jgi:hypothetical protein